MAEAAMKDSGLTKAQKAALLFLFLEEKGAASLFQKMSDDEIKKIGSTLLKMNEIPIEAMSAVLGEFYQSMNNGANTNEISGKIIFEKMVDKSLPKDRGRILLEEIQGGRGSKQNPIEDMVSVLSGEQVFRLIQNEHPQTIAVILSLLRPGQSKLVLSQFDPQTQVDLLFRISMLSRVPEAVLGILSATFKEKLSAGGTKEEKVEKKLDVEVPGLDLVLRFLKTQEWARAEAMIGDIEKYDPNIAAALRKKFFVLEDMLRADNNGIRNLLKSIETATLSIALKPANPEVQNKFFINMSSRAASIMKEDIEVMPEQKPEDVDAASEKILTEAKRLINEGQMILQAIES